MYFPAGRGRLGREQFGVVVLTAFIVFAAGVTCGCIEADIAIRWFRSILLCNRFTGIPALNHWRCDMQVESID